MLLLVVLGIILTGFILELLSRAINISPTITRIAETVQFAVTGIAFVVQLVLTLGIRLA